VTKPPGPDREREESSSSFSRYPLRFKFLALFLSLFFFLAIDLLLRLLGWMPPRDPLLSQAKMHGERFTPFVESQDGVVTIKAEWASKDEMYHGKRGELAGRLFLYPGFHPCRFAKEKPSNTIRIFAFGGSTTFGLFVGKEASFPGVMAERLRSLLPEHEVEVINLGCPGFDTARIRGLMDTVLGFDPDLFIVYSGHNEMLEGVADFQKTAFPAQLHRRLLSLSVIYGWMDYWLSGVDTFQIYEAVHEEEEAQAAERIPVYDPLEVPKDQWALPDKGWVRKAASTYKANIKAMASKAKEASLPVLFILPVSNLFLPPYISAHDEGFSEQDEFDALLERAWQTFRGGDPEEALTHLDRALSVSPDYAMAWYMRGMAYLSLGRQKQGFSELQKACELDVRTHRITSLFQSAMIAVMEESKVPWVDLRPAFYKELDPDFSKTVFVDRCHPTRYGHELIADKAMPYVTRLLRGQGIARAEAER
jgi:lysophospholipase L1-like esterase